MTEGTLSKPLLAGEYTVTRKNAVHAEMANNTVYLKSEGDVEDAYRNGLAKWLLEQPGIERVVWLDD